MSADARLKALEDHWKSMKWKKVANLFYVDLNDETMAHFVPLYRGSVLRIQAGVTNRLLNRMSWDISGLPKEFGSPKEQLTNANKCMLAIAHAELEIDGPQTDSATAQKISEFTLENARQFDSIAKIRQKIAEAPEPSQQYLLGDLVCVALACGDRDGAHQLIERAKAADPLFETTPLAKAERFLAHPGT